MFFPMEVFGGMFSVLFVVFWVVFWVAFIVIAVRALRQWSSNNQAPRLTVEAVVVAKRYAAEHRYNSATHVTDGFHYYYATFQVESGDRMELSLPGREYGLLAEGDRGRLSFQGTRFLGFARY